MPDHTTPTTRTIDSLLDRDRIRGATRMIPEGTTAEEVTQERVDAVRHNVSLYAQQSKLSRQQIGRAIGKSASVVSEFLTGKYLGDVASLAIDLDAWLEAEHKRQEAPQVCRFVWTSVARQIQAVGRTCQMTRTIGMVYGPETSGLGKTWALQAINRETPGSVYVSVEKVHATPTGLLRAIARTMRLGEGKRNASLFDLIKAALIGTPRLLLIDQIHNLRGFKGDKPFYILADLYDATNAPQLWAGTADLVEYLNVGQRKGDETLAQIRSRIFYQCDLSERARPEEFGGAGEPLYSVDEIRHIFASNKMRLSADGAILLCKIANISDGGGLRTATNIVILATMVGEMTPGSSLDARLLRSAWRSSTSSAKYQLAAELLTEQESRPAMRLAVSAG